MVINVPECCRIDQRPVQGSQAILIDHEVKVRSGPKADLSMGITDVASYAKLPSVLITINVSYRVVLTCLSQNGRW